MFILCCYYIIIILITFFRKKSNIKKLEILALRGGGSVCRANDTLKHPAYISMSFDHTHCPSFCAKYYFSLAFYLRL